MSHHDDAYLRHQRERWLRHDAHLWIRPDAARWVRPGFDPADVFPTLARDRAQAEAAKKRARAAEDAALDAFIEHERRVLAALRAELNEVKAELARRRRLAEAKYSPSQPRVPAGSPHGGQWTDRGGVQLAANLPDVPNKTPPDDPPPKVPQNEPDTREGRMRFARDAAQWVARNVVRRAPAVNAFFGALNQVEEIKALTDAIKSANDPAKTLEELQEPIGSKSQGGYQDHHIVGQHAGNRARFGDNWIDSRENQVRIPLLKHIDISAWYSRGSNEFGGLSPRDYLRDKDWDEQMRVGLDRLREHKVLK